MLRDWLKSQTTPYQLIDNALPKKGTIVDLGSGKGNTCIYLAQKKDRQIIGIDQDPDKINLAVSKTKNIKNITILQGNLLKQSLPKNISGFVISDVLHHLTSKQQQQVLERVNRHLKPGGVFIIKEINSHDVLRSKLSRLWDFLFYPQDKISYLSQNQLTTSLEKLGFKVNHRKTNLLTPASIHLYIATKK